MQPNNFDSEIGLLAKTELFADILPSDIGDMLLCSGARRAVYPKGSTIFWEGGEVRDVGVVLSGEGHAIKAYAGGRSLIVSSLGPGSVFGDVLALSRGHVSPVTVKATGDIESLLIPSEGMLSRCGRACARHDMLLRNTMRIVAEKYFSLFERIDCLTQPSIQDKVLIYLTRLSQRENSRTVCIPFDRAAMADYLHVDRSALSRELSRMKNEGIIDYYKNSFRLK